jgi:hypothetical protein
MSCKPRRSEGTRKRSLRLRSGQLYCLDRRSVSGASQGNSEASAADRTEREAVRPISVIRGKYSVISPPIGGRRFHLFLAYSTKHGKKVILFSAYYKPLAEFHLFRYRNIEYGK